MELLVWNSWEAAHSQNSQRKSIDIESAGFAGKLTPQQTVKSTLQNGGTVNITWKKNPWSFIWPLLLAEWG